MVATVPTAWRDGSLTRHPGANQGDRTAWTVSGDGDGTPRLTGVDLTDVEPQVRIGIRPDEQGALLRVIRKRPAWRLLVSDAPYGTVATPPGNWWTTGSLRLWRIVVDVAVALMLLAAVGPTGGHADLAKESRAGFTPTHKLKQLLQVTTRDPGVFAGPLGDLVAKRRPGVAQAGYQGCRGVAAEFPGVTSHHARQLLRDAIRGHVIELVEGHVGDVMAFHGVRRDNYAIPGVAHGWGGGGGR